MGTRRHIFWFATAILFASGPCPGAESPKPAANSADAAASRPAPAKRPQAAPPTLSDRQVVAHVLNRLAFGQRPGQVDELLQTGWKKWVERQLEPEGIEEPDLEGQLGKRFPALFMNMAEIYATYRPTDYQMAASPSDRNKLLRLQRRIRKELITSVLMRAIHSRRQFNEVIVEFWRNHFNVDQSKQEVAYLASHYEQNVIRKHAFGKFEDMLMASAKHPAMLIYLDNAVSQKALSDDEEKAARQARSRKVMRRILEQTRQSGLNENYARELMELHTLGVENENRRGGYSQLDVVEIARALTGWTADFTPDGKSYGFVFRGHLHDSLPKRVLGRRLRGNGGLKEGESIIRGLARDRRTAKFISAKLCRYFVDDDPPKKLVQRVAAVFHRTGGNLKRVYEAIIFSPQFLDPARFRSKFKTPFEFTVSAVRATGATIEEYDSLLGALGRMGQPIYEKEDPTGYYDQAEAWLDPGVLLHRWDFALQLAEGRLPGVQLDGKFIAELVKVSPDEMQRRVVSQLVPGGLDAADELALAAGMESFGVYRRQFLGLVLGSPAFQQQ
jgi:uncharacterized protein (DUF1800 family)